MEMSLHATMRQQQRGVRADVLSALINYGRVGHRGGQVFYMDKEARKLARAELGRESYGRLADKLNAYAVMSNDGVIVTVGKRLRRLKF